LQSQFNKVICNLLLEVEPEVLILACRLQVITVFLAIPAGTVAFICAVHFTP